MKNKKSRLTVKSMKIVILDKKTVTNGDISFDDIYALGDVTEYDTTAPEQLIERISGADAVICNKVVIDSDAMDACPELRYIGLFATGYNNIDITAAERHGITVCNVPAYSTSSVAQQVFAYILHFTNKTAEYSRMVSEGAWISSDTFSCFPLPLNELAGQTLGITGFGSIGKAVARIALAFGMKVLVYTRTPKQYEGVAFVSFDELLSRSDFITLHCPLTDATRGLITLEQLKKCKSTAVLINTSRGPVVNETDLRKALDEGIIAGAAVDVLEHEPMLDSCPLLGADNCIITPHIAWAPYQTRVRLIGIVAENLKKFIDSTPQNVVKE